MKKILIINHSSEIGGAELSLISLLRGLKEEFKIRVAAPLNGPLPDELEESGVEFIPFKMVQIRKTLNPVILFFYLFAMLFTVIRLKKLIRSEDPDIIHANSIRAGIITALARPPRFFIWHVRDTHGTGLYGSIIRKLAHRANKLVHISEYLKKEFCGNDLGLLNISTVVYNGIDFQEIDSVQSTETFRNEFRLSGKISPLIGIVGYIAPLKGQEDFLKAAEKIIEKFPNAAFFIAGDVIFRKKNRRFFKKLKTYTANNDRLKGRVYFTGYYKNIYLLIKSMDLLIQPSWTEGWGRTVCEGFGCNTPVACSDVGGIPEIVVKYKDSFLFEPQNIEDISETAIGLLNNPEETQNKTEDLKDYARQHFSIDKHINCFRKIYEEV